MRGKISIHETFIRHQILLDDSEEEDILIHLLPAITFIQSELDKGRGVLVHCQAGISRSATIVAAYLMYNRKMNVEEALNLVRKARPEIEPNPGFIAQLEIFQNASFTISRKDKSTRMYYMQRTTEEVMNGDGSLPSTDMFARFPRTGSDSTPPTPGGRGPRRRIRCKMCRQELATREHMLDHGQLGPATPTITPAGSRRPSTNQSHQPTSRRPSRLGSESRPRRPSGLSFGGLGDSLTMSSLNPNTSPSDKAFSPSILDDDDDDEEGEPTARPLTNADRNPRSSVPRPFANMPKSIMETMSTSALESEDEDDDHDVISPGAIKQTTIRHPLGMSGSTPTSPNTSAEVASHVGRRMSDAMLTPADDAKPGTGPQEGTILEPGSNDDNKEILFPEISSPAPLSPASMPSFSRPTASIQTPPVSPNDIVSQLHANPKLVLRGGVPSPFAGVALASGLDGSSVGGGVPKLQAVSPPILMNPKCSGYFVEPMQWMEPFLEAGEIAGKIICPNKKCGVKLGNYDWAGVCCGCKEWVVPGFCISRSKVDEIVA
ncbi:hypothetical protein BDP27DRAFT_1310007 [Rhodocollybia butyracea]|uniref:protein-tyrosine-phosphatase n=1 Tax=Rhodocollybia butyracea TaxID=206335 RepID=A0A9P5QAL7_9AGAR|nr:hypothetical protein BDP27DRAFT_1310007 [Rhodocollybia butyracea]